MLQGLQRQLDEGAESGKLVPMEAEQFMLNLLSLCAFPLWAAGGNAGRFGKKRYRVSTTP